MKKQILAITIVLMTACGERAADGNIGSTPSEDPKVTSSEVKIPTGGVDVKQSSSVLNSSGIATSSSIETSSSSIVNSNLGLFIGSWSGESIPLEFACVEKGGQNISPVVRWSYSSKVLKSFAVFAEDKSIACNGASCVHWNVYNITEDTKSLDQLKQYLKSGAIEGLNYKSDYGWAGPCPPSGKHTYRFTLFALSTKLQQNIANSESLEKQYSEFILGKQSIEAEF